MNKKLDEESHRWLQCNIEPKKVAPIIVVQEQMVETRAWKANIGLTVESDKCRICRQPKETVIHWLPRRTRLAATEYLKRNNNALMIVCGIGVQEGLLGKNMKWYKKGKTREQSLRMMNVSYAGTSNIMYVKQQQQVDQM